MTGSSSSFESDPAAGGGRPSGASGDDAVSKLADAIDAYLARASGSDVSDGGPASESESLLSEHRDLAEFLEPMLRADSTDDPGENSSRRGSAPHGSGPRRSGISGSGVDGLETEAPDIDPLPDQIGSYRIVREIGRGGMGIVYEAEHVTLDRRVALKVLPALMSLSARRIERFLREAKAIARLDHPGLAHVHEVGEAEGTWFFAMELVDGDNLRDLAREIRHSCGRDPRRLGDRPRLDLPGAPTRYDEIAELGIQIAEALQCVHDDGLVHRDVKPQNILLDAGKRVRLVDFGLAKDLRDQSLTLTGDFAGTPHYGSPEQVVASHSERPLDGRSDVFSLGSVLYELLALRRPFEGETTDAVLRAIREDDPRPVRTLAPGVPRDLETIVMRCLEKLSERRYPAAAELAADLRRFRARARVHARPVTALRRFARWTAKHRARAALLGLTFVVVVVGPAVTSILLQQRNSLIAERARLVREQAEVLEAKNAQLEEQRSLLAEQRDSARANLDLARQTVDHLFTMVAELDLPDRPHLQQFRRQLLDEAHVYYGEVERRAATLEKPADDEAEPRAPLEDRLRAIQATMRLARLDIELGRSGNARQDLDQAVERLEDLLDSAADSLDGATRAKLRDELAAVLADRGLNRLAVATTPAANAELERAEQLWRALMADEATPVPVRRRSALRLARMREKRATAREYQAPEEAREDFATALELLDAGDRFGPSLDRSRAHAGLSRLAMTRGDLAEARAELESARAGLPSEGGRARDIQEAKLQRLRGRIAERDGDPGQAIRNLAAAHLRLQQLRDDFPADDVLRYECANTGAVLARLRLMGRVGATGTRAVIKDTLKDVQQLFAAHPQPRPRRIDHLGAIVYGYAALIYSSTFGPDSPEPAEIDDLFSQSTALRRSLSAAQPDRADLHGELGGTLNNHARYVLSGPLRDADRAATLLAEAITSQRKAIELDPDQLSWRRYLHNHLVAFASCELQRGNGSSAAESLLEAVRTERGDGRPNYQLSLARQFLNVAAAVGSATDLRTECHSAAIDALERVVARSPDGARGTLEDAAFDPLRSDPRFRALADR